MHFSDRGIDETRIGYPSVHRTAAEYISVRGKEACGLFRIILPCGRRACSAGLAVAHRAVCVVEPVANCVLQAAASPRQVGEVSNRRVDQFRELADDRVAQRIAEPRIPFGEILVFASPRISELSSVHGERLFALLFHCAPERPALSVVCLNQGPSAQTG